MLCVVRVKPQRGVGRLRARGGLCPPSLTPAVLLTPQIIRVQSPEGVKRITATKREMVATFLKKVPPATPCFPGRGCAAGADVLTAARIAASCGKRWFYRCSQNQFSHCCSRGNITKLRSKTYSAFQLELPRGGHVFRVLPRKWQLGKQRRRKAGW